ncbi:MAG: TRAP transporter substrate-binding protein [Burkholderiaceae bacterium]|jgi:TRAP-type C4-dicarboxylate transport system substrate-binding protein
MKRITLALAGLGLATALGTVPAHAETVIPLATWGGTNHINIRHFVPALEQAIKETKPNNLVLQHFPGGQLGQDKDMPVAIPTGQVKLAWITVNGWTGTVPDTRIMDAPTGLTMKQLDELIDRPNGLMSVLQKKFEEKNTVLLGLADLGPPAVVSKTPIKSPADFKGKKVRVFSEGLAEAVRAFGGSPVSLPFAEIYSAMQYGTVDAAIIGFQGVGSQRMYEVAKHVLVPASFLGTTMMGWAANKPWLAGLPEQDRKAFIKAMDIASHENRKAIVAEIDELAKDYEKRGMTVTFLSPEQPEYAQWKEATQPLLQAILGKLSPDVAGLFKN